MFLPIDYNLRGSRCSYDKNPCRDQLSVGRSVALHVLCCSQVADSQAIRLGLRPANACARRMMIPGGYPRKWTTNDRSQNE
jgi:hypothetical protein